MSENDGDVAGQRRTPWCARVGAHIAELQSQINRIEAADSLSPADAEVAKKARVQLDAARAALKGGWWARITGAAHDRAMANIHEAEIEILRITPEADLRWRGVRILAQCMLHLHSGDLGLKRLGNELKQGYAPLNGKLRELAAGTLHEAFRAEEAERARVRSFGHIVAFSIVIMTALAAAFMVWSFVDPAGVASKFCFEPDLRRRVCPIGAKPDGSDVLLVEFSGMLAAALAGTASLKKMRGTAGPYHIPALLLILRLPVGALSAVLGVLLVSGEFIPGLTALDTDTQILAWAAVFGILQESVTRTLDKQGQLVLDNVRAPERGFETGPTVREAPRVGDTRRRMTAVERIRSRGTGSRLK
ncbi:hypothetical protein ACSNOJ_25060 [Streptomyces sp. URMC 128]|uniref:hypothetical protein n=1 Tax=Streptomyces sp. URMC 128 TaxID=3423404 RepID=UPI003F1D7BC5